MARIALDVMGSDHGVAEMVAGAARLSSERQAIEMMLVGDAALIQPAQVFRTCA